MFRRRFRCAALAVTALACAAHGNTYLWTAGGVTDYWDNNSNWTPILTPGTHPNASTDDAIISNTSGGDDVELITEDIDDLTISDDVNFTPKSGSPTLTVDRFSISGAVVTISGATIETRQ